MLWSYEPEVKYEIKLSSKANEKSNSKVAIKKLIFAPLVTLGLEVLFTVFVFVFCFFFVVIL